VRRSVYAVRWSYVSVTTKDISVFLQVEEIYQSSINMEHPVSWVLSVPTALCAYSPLCLQPTVPTALCAYSPLCLQPTVPTALFAYSPLFLQPTVPTALCVYSPFCLQPSVPTAHCAYGPLCLQPSVPTAHCTYIPLCLQPSTQISNCNTSLIKLNSYFCYDFSSQRLEFNSTPVHVGFALVKGTWIRFFPRTYPGSVITSLLHGSSFINCP